MWQVLSNLRTFHVHTSFGTWTPVKYIYVYGKKKFPAKQKFELLTILEWNKKEEKNIRENSVEYIFFAPCPHFRPWFLKKYMDAKLNDIFSLLSSAIKLILFMFVFPSKWALTLRIVNIHQSQSMLCIFTTLNDKIKKKKEPKENHQMNFVDCVRLLFICICNAHMCTSTYH